MAAKPEDGLLARQYIDYIYVPAGLLVVGTAIVKMDWTPYAVLLAIALGVWNYYSFREYSLPSHLGLRHCAFVQLKLIVPVAEIKKVLKPDVFQEFPLQEKTVISHNVAM